MNRVATYRVFQRNSGAKISGALSPWTEFHSPLFFLLYLVYFIILGAQKSGRPSPRRISCQLLTKQLKMLLT